MVEVLEYGEITGFPGHSRSSQSHSKEYDIFILFEVCLMITDHGTRGFSHSTSLLLI